MLRKLGGIWLILALCLGFALGISGLALALPVDAVAASDAGIGSDGIDISDPGDPGDDAIGATGPSDTVDPDRDVDSEPEPEPVVTASVTSDERVVRLSASDPSIADATRVVFHVWLEGQRGSSLIEHEAVRGADGTWNATAYVASNTFDDPGVPYSCRVADAVHRLYNPYSKQHLFTSDTNEADGLSRIGWRYEGVAWVEPRAEDPNVATGTAAIRQPVYRLYNPYTGDHFFTLDRTEYDALPSSGWEPEGVAFESLPNGGMAVYRVYNPYLASGSHLFTSSANEYRTLVSSGWRDEGVAWYGDVLNADGTWCAQAQNRFHDQPGTYHVEAVATRADAAQPVTLGETGFAISRPTATARIENVRDSQGAYDVVVSDVRSVSGIAHVYVPSWTVPGGQDDLVWHEAARQGDGSYRATVGVNRHSFDHDFASHVYLKSGNGLMVNVAQLSQHLTLANYLRMTGGPYTYTVSIYNPGNVGRVQMPTWSDQGGQDDIVWFDARNDGNGWWSATVDVSRLAHSGVVHTHVYADGQFRGAVPDYTIQPWEILAWRYRNMNDRIRDLSSPTGWLLAVDTVNCITGVYQGSRGNWTNRYWWDCAPGTAYTPTVKGLFHVQSRGYSFGHGYTCYWWTQFYGDYLFHSIKYYEGTFTPMDPTLGSPASLGCVRLDINNAKWIHDNIPSGTTVLVY